MFGAHKIGPGPAFPALFGAIVVLIASASTPTRAFAASEFSSWYDASVLSHPFEIAGHYLVLAAPLLLATTVLTASGPRRTGVSLSSSNEAPAQPAIAGRDPQRPVDPAAGGELAAAALQEQLAHCQRLATLGQLAASTLHELTQPLAGLVNFLHACKQDLAQSELDALGSDLQAAARQAAHLTEIIHRCRGFSASRNGVAVRVVLESLIRDAQEMVRWKGKELGIDIRSRVEPPGLSLVCDPLAIRQALVNLLSNALDATAHAKCPKPAVWVEAAQSGATVCVRVIDRGVGLTDSAFCQLFSPFHTTKPGGLGLGLAVSRQLVEARGGQLLATRNEAGGMTFELSFPVLSETSA